jgi:hypothetical protein
MHTRIGSGRFTGVFKNGPIGNPGILRSFHCFGGPFFMTPGKHLVGGFADHLRVEREEPVRERPLLPGGMSDREIFYFIFSHTRIFLKNAEADFCLKKFRHQ